MNNVTFSTVNVYEYHNGRNVHGLFTAYVVANYHAKNGRMITALGWTQETALRNLRRKCGPKVTADREECRKVIL